MARVVTTPRVVKVPDDHAFSVSDFQSDREEALQRLEASQNRFYLPQTNLDRFIESAQSGGDKDRCIFMGVPVTDGVIPTSRKHGDTPLYDIVTGRKYPVTKTGDMVNQIGKREGWKINRVFQMRQIQATKSDVRRLSADHVLSRRATLTLTEDVVLHSRLRIANQDPPALIRKRQKELLEEAGVYMGKQHELLTDMNSEWPSRQLATATALQKLVGEDCLANINALKQPQIPQLQPKPTRNYVNYYVTDAIGSKPIHNRGMSGYGRVSSRSSEPVVVSHKERQTSLLDLMDHAELEESAQLTPLPVKYLRAEMVDQHSGLFRWQIDPREIRPYESLSFAIAVTPLKSHRHPLLFRTTKRYFKLSDLEEKENYRLQVNVVDANGVKSDAVELIISKCNQDLPFAPVNLCVERNEELVNIEWDVDSREFRPEEQLSWQVELDSALHQQKWVPIDNVRHPRITLGGLHGADELRARVCVVDQFGMRSNFTEVFIPRFSINPPPAPRNLHATYRLMRDLVLVWSEPEAETINPDSPPLRYRLYFRVIGQNARWRQLGETEKKNMTITNFDFSESMEFRLVSYNEFGESIPVYLCWAEKELEEPTNFIVVSNNDNEINLQWTKPPSHMSSAVPPTYIIDIKQVPETDWSPCRKVVGDTEVTITGFDPTQPILVRLFATSGTGMSNPVYALVNPGGPAGTFTSHMLTAEKSLDIAKSLDVSGIPSSMGDSSFDRLGQMATDEMNDFLVYRKKRRQSRHFGNMGMDDGGSRSAGHVGGLGEGGPPLRRTRSTRSGRLSLKQVQAFDSKICKLDHNQLQDTEFIEQNLTESFSGQSRRKMLMDIEDAVFSGSTGVGTGASLRVESKDFKVESFEEDSLTVNFQDVMKKSLQEESQYDYESLSRSRFSSRRSKSPKKHKIKRRKSSKSSKTSTGVATSSAVLPGLMGSSSILKEREAIFTKNKNQYPTKQLGIMATFTNKARKSVLPRTTSNDSHEVLFSANFDKDRIQEQSESKSCPGVHISGEKQQFSPRTAPSVSSHGRDDEKRMRKWSRMSGHQLLEERQRKKRATLPAEVITEIEKTKFVTQRKDKDSDYLGTDILKHIPFGKKTKHGTLPSQRPVGRSQYNPYPMTNEFATQLCRIRHPEDEREQFRIEVKDDSETDFRLMGTTESRDYTCQLLPDRRYHVRISEASNQLLAYRLQLEPRDRQTDDCTHAELTEITLDYENIFKMTPEPDHGDVFGERGMPGADGGKEGGFNSKTQKRIALTSRMPYGVLPPVNITVAPLYGHELFIGWSSVPQPKCVITIKDEVDEEDLPQIVREAKIDILNQWNQKLDEVMDPNTNLFDKRLLAKNSNVHVYTDISENDSAAGSRKGPHKLLVESEGTTPGLPMAPPTNEDTFYHVQMFVQHAENPEEGSWIEVGKTNNPHGMVIDVPDMDESCEWAFRVLTEKGPYASVPSEPAFFVIGRESKKDAESPYVKLEKRERQNLEGQQQERPSADVNVTELKLLSPIPKKEYNLDQLPVAETFSKDDDLDIIQGHRHPDLSEGFSALSTNLDLPMSPAVSSSDVTEISSPDDSAGDISPDDVRDADMGDQDARVDHSAFNTSNDQLLVETAAVDLKSLTEEQSRGPVTPQFGDVFDDESSEVFSGSDIETAVSGKKKVGKQQKRRQVVIGEEVAKVSEKPTSTADPSTGPNDVMLGEIGGITVIAKRKSSATNQAAGEMKVEVEKEPHLNQDGTSRVVKKQPPSLSSKSSKKSLKKGLKEKTTGVGDEAVNMKKGLSVSETKGEVIETEMSDFVDEESDPTSGKKKKKRSKDIGNKKTKILRKHVVIDKNVAARDLENSTPLIPETDGPRNASQTFAANNNLEVGDVADDVSEQRKLSSVVSSGPEDLNVVTKLDGKEPIEGEKGVLLTDDEPRKKSQRPGRIRKRSSKPAGSNDDRIATSKKEIPKTITLEFQSSESLSTEQSREVINQDKRAEKKLVDALTADKKAEKEETVTINIESMDQSGSEAPVESFPEDQQALNVSEFSTKVQSERGIAKSHPKVSTLGMPKEETLKEVDEENDADDDDKNVSKASSKKRTIEKRTKSRTSGPMSRIRQVAPSTGTEESKVSETDHFQISTVDTDVENEQQETYLDVPIVEDEQNQFGHRGSRVRLRSIDDIQKPEKKEKKHSVININDEDLEDNNTTVKEEMGDTAVVETTEPSPQDKPRSPVQIDVDDLSIESLKSYCDNQKNIQKSRDVDDESSSMRTQSTDYRGQLLTDRSHVTPMGTRLYESNECAGVSSMDSRMAASILAIKFLIRNQSPFGQSGKGVAEDLSIIQSRKQRQLKAQAAADELQQLKDWRNANINKHNGVGLEFRGARFELPIDTKTLEQMNLLTYLKERCFLDGAMEKVLSTVFWRYEKEKRKYILPEECRIAWLDLFGCKIDDQFIDDVFNLLGVTQNDCNGSSSNEMWPQNNKGEIMIDQNSFCKITAVCKRLLYVSMRGSTWYTSYGAPIYDPLEQTERDYIEVADFSGLPNKLEKYQLNSKLKTLLLTLYEPKMNCPFSLDRTIYRNVVDNEEYQIETKQRAPE